MAVALYDGHMLHMMPQGTPPEPPEEAPTPSNPTIYVKLGDFTEQESKVGGRPATWLTSSVHQAKDTDDKFQKYAMVLRRRIDPDGELLSMTLEVYSQYIRDYLQKIIRDYPYLNLAAFPVEIRQPYGVLFHHRQIIKQDTATMPPGPERDHLEVLVDFIKKHLGDVEREYQQNVINGNPPKIFFDNVWTLFQPSTIVVSQGVFHECAEVLSCEYRIGDKGRKLVIEALQWDYNGEMKVFGSATLRLKIRAFVGLQRISGMSVCPLEFAEADQESSVHKEDIIERGKRWRDLVDFGHKEYNGAAWVEPFTERASKLKELVPVHVIGRVIIDCRAHERENLPLKSDVGFVRIATEGTRDVDSKGKRTMEDRLTSHRNVESYHIDEDMALITPARVRGYSLQRKVWAFFLVDNISSIEWMPVHFDRLELESGIKDIVLSLVKFHQSASESLGTIATKGSGLVMLLHGPPGSGKTLTAESIAEKTERPLLALSSGDLGTNPDTTERRLRLHFDLAKTWKAVILLDEADVFLAKRTAGNIGRNAFVSIFLRLLEYYQGILFLTTNRVDEFDAAFQSRIHFAIKYPPLDQKQRAAIWRGGIQGILESAPESSQSSTTSSQQCWTLDTYERLGELYRINGREIKNLLHVANIVSSAQGKVLTEDLIHSVFKLNHRPQDEALSEGVEGDIEDDLEDLDLSSSWSAPLPSFSSTYARDYRRRAKAMRTREQRMATLRRHAVSHGVPLLETKGRRDVKPSLIQRF